MQDIKKLNTKRLIKKFEQYRKSNNREDILCTIKIMRILINRGYFSFVYASMLYDNIFIKRDWHEIKKPTGGVITTAELAK